MRYGVRRLAVAFITNTDENHEIFYSCKQSRELLIIVVFKNDKRRKS